MLTINLLVSAGPDSTRRVITIYQVVPGLWILPIHTTTSGKVASRTMPKGKNPATMSQEMETAQCSKDTSTLSNLTNLHS